MSSGKHFTQVLSVNLHYQASDTRSRERKFLVKKKCYSCIWWSVPKIDDGKRTNTSHSKQENQFKPSERPLNTKQGITTHQGSSRSDCNWKDHYYGQHEESAEDYTQSRRAAYLDSVRSDHDWHGHYYGQQDERTEKRPSERCLKCGMTNHVTFDCFHQRQVQCFKCKCYGHKYYMGLCWNV